MSSKFQVRAAGPEYVEDLGTMNWPSAASLFRSSGANGTLMKWLKVGSLI